jgi:cell division protein FtsX
MRHALTGFERALFWTLVFAVFAAVAAGLAARAVDRLAAGYESERTNYAIIRVLAPEGPEAMTAAQTALADAPHVASAAPMNAGRAAALLRQWGGGDVRAEDMPDLRLIEVELAPAAAGADVSGDIAAALARGGVTGELIQAPDTASGGGVSDRVRAAAFVGALGFAAVMALIISLAARGLAARRRELVTVMCDLGATRGQAAGRIADEAAMLGLGAGVIGALAAGALAVFIILMVMPGVSFDTLLAMIRPIDLAPIIAAPVAAAFAAGFGARAAAGDFHNTAARLG